MSTKKPTPTEEPKVDDQKECCVTNEELGRRIDGLEDGHIALTAELSNNTAMTRQALEATEDVKNILITLKTLATVAKYVSAFAIAVTSVWGVVLLFLSSGGGGITPK